MPAMRSALLGLTLFLAALPLTAQVERLSLSSVTLSTTYSRTAEPNDPVARDGNSVISTPRLDTIRFGNAELLEVMRQGGLLDDNVSEPAVAETSINGWALVAVWADWPETGNSYRFFARKRASGQIRVVAVPETLLRLDLNAFYVRKNVRTDEESTPVSGTFLYKVNADLNLGIDTRDRSPEEIEDGVRRGTASITDGVLVASGRYARPSKTQSVIFLPGRASFTGYGQSDLDDEEIRDLVIASLRLGAASAVAAEQFPATSGNNSRGPETTAANVD